MRFLLFWSVLLGTLITLLSVLSPVSHAERGQSLPEKRRANPPLPMTRLASFDGWEDYAVVGDYLYASESQRLNILGFDTPDSLRPVGEQFTDLSLGLLEADSTNRHLFALSGTRTLILFDTRNPLAPVERHRVAIPELGDYGGIKLMQFMGGHLYLLSESQQRIYIYSGAGNTLTLKSTFSYTASHFPISNGGETEAEPELFPRNGWAMFLEGNTLVVTNYFGGASQQLIRLYDVSDVAQPRLAGTVPTLGGLAIPANGHLYVFNRPVGSTYLDIWNIQNPDAPQLASSIPNVNGLPISRYGNQIIVQQPAYSGQWHWYDVTNPTALQSIAVVVPPARLAVDSNHWLSPTSFYYLRETSSGSGLNETLERATLTNGSTLSSVSLYRFPWVGKSIIVADRYLYTWGDYAGVNIYDLQTPATPRFVARRLIPEFPNLVGLGFGVSAEKSGNRLYVNRGADMAILNTDNPLDPYLTATFTFDAPNQYAIFHATPEYLYARAQNPGRLLAIRLSDYQSSVTLLPCYGIGIDGDLLIATCGTPSNNDYALQIWDLANPLAPQLRGTIARSSPFGAVVEVAAPYAYVMSGAAIEIYDVSNRDLPIHTYTVPPNSGQQSCLHLSPIGNGHYLRQCSSTTQDDIVNLGNPNGPQMTATFGFPQTYYSPEVVGDTVYFVEGRTFQSWQINAPFIYLPFVNRYNLPFIQGR